MVGVLMSALHLPPLGTGRKPALYMWERERCTTHYEFQLGLKLKSCNSFFWFGHMTLGRVGLCCVRQKSNAATM